MTAIQIGVYLLIILAYTYDIRVRKTLIGGMSKRSYSNRFVVDK